MAVAISDQERQNYVPAPPSGGLRWPLSVDDDSTVVRARALIQGALTVLGMDTDAVDNAELMVAELVGNAVKHAQPPIEMQLHVDTHGAVIHVFDGSPTLPDFPAVMGGDLLFDADEVDVDYLIEGLADNGRGLAIVQRCSGGQCGASSHPTMGKAVWFCVESAELLPMTGSQHAAMRTTRSP